MPEMWLQLLLARPLWLEDKRNRKQVFGGINDFCSCPVLSRPLNYTFTLVGPLWTDSIGGNGVTQLLSVGHLVKYLSAGVLACMSIRVGIILTLWCYYTLTTGYFTLKFEYHWINSSEIVCIKNIIHPFSSPLRVGANPSCRWHHGQVA